MMINKLNLLRNAVAGLFSLTVYVMGTISLPTMVLAQNKNELVRLAVIEVDSFQVERYYEYLQEEIEASVRLEPGVITLYGVAEKENRERVTLFETYADSAEYKAHLATPHFQKYKQGTQHMVNNLQLISMEPILYHRKPSLSTIQREQLYIRLIKMEIDPSTTEKFRNLATTCMLPGIKNEPGVLVMYAVAEKDHPSRVSILEVYENPAAYQKHLETKHYLKYKGESRKLVRSLQFIDVREILLGSKPQE